MIPKGEIVVKTNPKIDLETKTFINWTKVVVGPGPEI